MTDKFTPTHRITNIETRKEVLVQELVGEREFYDEQEYLTWGSDFVGIGNYAQDGFDDDTILTRSSQQDPELEEIVTWDKAPYLRLSRICVRCHSDSIVRNGTNGYSQRYKCKDCFAVFTGTKLGRSCIGR